jgi:hypothetical protein
MKPYFARTLVEDFPILYGQHYGDMRVTAMCWGFEIGDGWERIVRDLSQHLEFLNENTPVHVEAVQVKEKFGGLRFYVGGVEGGKFWADIVFALIDAAEMRSCYTCEDCGKWGRERPGGWIRTLCDACYDRQSQPTEAP